MKKINNYITEKLNKISSKNIGKTYNYFPKDKNELEQIITDLIKERGNEADLNDIDTSNITDMSDLFCMGNDSEHFNGDISEWDVSNVENMRRIFGGSKFNGDISGWDVSKVKYMTGMFVNSKFNGDISKWDVSNVKNMSDMFRLCPLEKNPPKWYKK